MILFVKKTIMKVLSIYEYIKNVYLSWEWTDEEVQKYERLIQEWGELEIKAAHDKIAEPIPDHIKNNIREAKQKIKSIKNTVWERRKKALFPQKNKSIDC